MPRSSRRRSSSLSDSSAHSSDEDLSSLFSSSSSSREEEPQPRPSTRSSGSSKSKKKGVVYRSLPAGGGGGSGQAGQQEREELQDAPEKTARPTTAPGPGQTQAKTGSSPTTWIIIAIVVLILLCAAGGAAYYFRDDLFGTSSSTAENDTAGAAGSSGSKSSGGSSSLVKSSPAARAGTNATSAATNGTAATNTVSSSGTSKALSGSATSTAPSSSSTSSTSGISFTNTYTLLTSCTGSSFFNCFTFNPSKGLSATEAQSGGLVSVEEEKAYLRLNSWEDSETGERPGLFLEMREEYKWRYGLVVVDVGKMPFGCGAWSSIFSFGSDWPAGGGIDTLEGVSLQSHSTPTIITSSNECKIGSEEAMTGTPLEGHTSCADVPESEKVDGYAGCSVENPSEASYGEKWNEAGGGVLATLVDENGIFIWQFPRSAVTSDGHFGDAEGKELPDPGKWGKPLASWPKETCSTELFGEQTLAITLMVCGFRPEAVWSSGGCSKLADSCAEYAKTGKNLENMVWEFNYLRLYSVETGGASTGKEGQGEEDEELSTTTLPLLSTTTLPLTGAGGEAQATR